jgi:glyoxylase-like metal-dependent hydrolase (beta-lactamase superfamily II)
MDFVWRQTFDQTRVAVISEGRGWWPIDSALENVPEELWRPLIETDQAKRMSVGFNVVHVSLPDASILLDTGWGRDTATNVSEPILASLAFQPTLGVEAGLARLGIQPTDITHVLVSHMHSDHVVGATKVVQNERSLVFPKARYFVMEEEWCNAPAPWNPLAGLIAAQKETLLKARMVSLVRGEQDIVPGVTFVPAPGESPGHAIVRIRTETRPLYYVADLFHHPAELIHMEWMPRHRDSGKLIDSRKKLIPRFVAEDAWLIPAHFPFPPIGRIELSGDGYAWKSLE